MAVAAAGLVAAPGAGLNVTGIDAPGAAGCCPGTAGCWPCGKFVAGDWMGAAGFTAAGFVGACAPGLMPAGAGGFCAGGGDWATDVITSAIKQTETMNGVFIVLLNQEFDGTIAVQECLYRKITTGESSKTFHFFAPRECVPCFQYHQRQDIRQVFHIIRWAESIGRVTPASSAIATLFSRLGQPSIVAASLSPA